MHKVHHLWNRAHGGMSALPTESHARRMTNSASTMSKTVSSKDSAVRFRSGDRFGESVERG